VAIAQYRKRETTGQARREVMGPVRAYLTFVGITMINPMTVIYFTALVLASQGSTGSDYWDRGVFVVAACVASTSWQLLMAGGGALLGRLLTGPCGRLCTSLVSSVVILGLAVHLLLA
jgi:arginine exporter protein ArgO